MYDPTVFYSPTLGSITEPEMVRRIRSFIAEEPEYHYQLIIGTDSLPNGHRKVYLVTAIVLHRLGNGGIYFWQRTLAGPFPVLRSRIHAEVAQSVTLAERVQKLLTGDGIGHHIEIHVDVGQVGETRDIIREVVGMIKAYGYQPKTKPEAFAAYCVADRHTTIPQRHPALA